MKARTAVCIIALVALAGCERRGPDGQPEDTEDPAPQTEPGENAVANPQRDLPATPAEPPVDPSLPAEAARAPATAEARIEPTRGHEVSGVVRFSAANGMLTIAGTIDGLEPGEHGLHVHEKGDCSAPDASSAGGHFNPDQDPHGSPRDDPDSHHVGDFGNISADADGEAEVSVDDPEMQLTGPDSVVGKALVVHGGRDDFETQPAGDSGPRVGCGVIRATGSPQGTTAGG